MKADLHIHSNFSDGSDTIDEIVKQAITNGLDTIAITDHDTLSHLPYIPTISGIHIIGGIEISAFHKQTNTKAHILGYNIKKPLLVNILTQKLLFERNRNSEMQVDILIENGYKIDKDKLVRTDGKYLYKQHILEWLVSTGQIKEMFDEFYFKTFKNGGICDFDIEYIDVFNAVKTIRDAGGVAVLAHPGQQQNYWMIPELVKFGLNGLEYNHNANSDMDKKLCAQIALNFGLFLTGGSDYHGKYENQPCQIGDYLSDESGVKAICQN